MINDNIFNIFSFLTFSFGYFRNPVFWPNWKKISPKTKSKGTQKKKFEKLKMLKMQKKHIYFYLKNSKLFLVLKKHVFKQGVLLLKSLISNKVDRNTNNKVIKNFYNLLINWS